MGKKGGYVPLLLQAREGNNHQSNALFGVIIKGKSMDAPLP
jgi:hypothetical protein